MTKAKYEVTGKIVGVKKGEVVEFEKLPRAYQGRVRQLPDDLTPKQPEKAATRGEPKGDKK